jgi:methyl-accepting chemotaxis protein
MEEVKGFLDAGPTDIEESVKNIDRRSMAFAVLESWPFEDLLSVDRFVTFIKNRWTKGGEKKLFGTDRDQMYEIYHYLSITIMDCLGPMAYGRKMGEYFKLTSDASLDDIKIKLTSLLALARFLKARSDELKPIIKKLAEIDKAFYVKPNKSEEFKQLIEPMISLQANSILALVAKTVVNDKQMMNFIKDVRDKITNVNKLLEASRLAPEQHPSVHKGGHLSDYDICRRRYLYLKRSTLPQSHRKL